MNIKSESPLEIKSSFKSDQLHSTTLDFFLTHKISNKEKEYLSAHDAQWSPLVSKIFGFPWVSKVKITPKTISITRQDWVQWDILAEPLNDMIQHHLSFYDESQSIEENQEPPKKKTLSPKIQIPEKAKPIHDFIEYQINPQLSEHGGRIELVDYQEGKLFLEMQGGCQGCGMAAQTMKEGIDDRSKKGISLYYTYSGYHFAFRGTKSLL